MMWMQRVFSPNLPAASHVLALPHTLLINSPCLTFSLHCSVQVASQGCSSQQASQKV